MAVWGEDLADFAFELVVVTAPWVAGVAVRTRRQQAEGADRRAAAATERAATAVADERARIARELHDVVAHAVGMMVVQAGAASQLLDQDPARARQCLDAVQHRPDVVLMDIQMPGLDGIEATKEIVRSGLPTRVLILTTFGIETGLVVPGRRSQHDRRR